MLIQIDDFLFDVGSYLSLFHGNCWKKLISLIALELAHPPINQNSKLQTAKLTISSQFRDELEHESIQLVGHEKEWATTKFQQ